MMRFVKQLFRFREVSPIKGFDKNTWHAIIKTRQENLANLKRRNHLYGKRRTVGEIQKRRS